MYSWFEHLPMTRQKYVVQSTLNKRADLRFQKCYYAWFSHTSSQFVMVKQTAPSLCAKIFHMQLFQVHHYMSLANLHSDITNCRYKAGKHPCCSFCTHFISFFQWGFFHWARYWRFLEARAVCSSILLFLPVNRLTMNLINLKSFSQVSGQVLCTLHTYFVAYLIT